jgi:hypothetical protein
VYKQILIGAKLKPGKGSQKTEVLYGGEGPHWTVVPSKKKWSENCSLLGYYAARSGKSLPTFRDSLSVPSYVSKKLPLLAA